MKEGLEDAPETSGWTKTRAFGHVAYARRSVYSIDVHGNKRQVLLLAMRIGNIPLGVPFRRYDGPWAVMDILEDDVDAMHAQGNEG
jgi:hypothetical protein